MDGVVLQMQQAGSADPGPWVVGSSVLSHRENAGHLVSSPIVILLFSELEQYKQKRCFAHWYILSSPVVWPQKNDIFFRGSLVPKAMPSLPWWGAETFFGLRLLTLGFTQRIRRVPVRMGGGRAAGPMMPLARSPWVPSC